MFLFQAVISTNESIVQGILSFATASPFALKVYLFLKIIAIIYTVILFIAVILVVLNARPKKIVKEIEENLESVIGERKEEEKGEGYGGRWREILKMLDLKEESSWRVAIIEADKFFDEIMRRLGYSGENFGERLKQIHPTEISNLNDVWQAHRVRNSISHDINFKVSQDEARRAIGAYERAMRDLEVL